jgi:RNA polymerase sigma-70 factor, ECF subfamily
MNNGTMDEGNDLDLVRLCLSGEEAGASGLMDRYGPHLLAAGLNVLMNREDAEDVVQETFCRAFRHLNRFDGARSFRTWLFAIWYRRCMDVFRKRSRFRRFSTGSPPRAVPRG